MTDPDWKALFIESGRAYLDLAGKVQKTGPTLAQIFHGVAVYTETP